MPPESNLSVEDLVSLLWGLESNNKTHSDQCASLMDYSKYSPMICPVCLIKETERTLHLMRLKISELRKSNNELRIQLRGVSIGSEVVASANPPSPVAAKAPESKERKQTKAFFEVIHYVMASPVPVSVDDMMAKFEALTKQDG